MAEYLPPSRDNGGWAASGSGWGDPEPEFEVLVWLVDGAQDVEIVGVGVTHTQGWSREAAERSAREFLAERIDRRAGSFRLRIWHQTSW
jgi:hypothetical protein